MFAGSCLAASSLPWTWRFCTWSCTRIFWLARYEHRWHAYGFSPVCILMCFFKFPLCVKGLLHTGHGWMRREAFSPDHRPPPLLLLMMEVQSPLPSCPALAKGRVAWPLHCGWRWGGQCRAGGVTTPLQLTPGSPPTTLCRCPYRKRKPSPTLYLVLFFLSIHH